MFSTAPFSGYEIAKSEVTNSSASIEFKHFHPPPFRVKNNILYHRMKEKDGDLFVKSTKRPYQCEICMKTFTQQSNLQKHALIHAGIKKYSCHICGKKFVQQVNLYKHLRVHTGEKPFECQICCRRFTQKANMEKHTQCHTGEKNFKCNICDRFFAQRVNMERHRRVHTGEKPYVCNQCGKRFTQSGNLTKHASSHHSPNSSRHFVDPGEISRKKFTGKYSDVSEGPFFPFACLPIFLSDKNTDVSKK